MSQPARKGFSAAPTGLGDTVSPPHTHRKQPGTPHGSSKCWKREEAEIAQIRWKSPQSPTPWRAWERRTAPRAGGGRRGRSWGPPPAGSPHALSLDFDIGCSRSGFLATVFNPVIIFLSFEHALILVK